MPVPAATGRPTAAAETVPTPPPILVDVGGGEVPPGSEDVIPVLPVVGGAAGPEGEAAWAVASDGGVFSFGGARFHGSMGGVPLNQPVVGMAATPTGGGYWLVAADGGIFAFGDADFHGSMGGVTLNQPVVGMAPTPTGGGYWLVAADGGIFSFGDAPFHGSTGNLVLNEPVVGMTTTPTGDGYWFVAADGGIFSYGDAPFHGSTGADPAGPQDPVAGMAATPTGGGYWLATEAGVVHAFGDAAPAPVRVDPLDGVVTAVLAVDGRPWLVRQRVGPSIGLWQSGGLRETTLARTLDAAAASRTRATVIHRGTLGVLAVERAGATVDRPPGGFRYPFAALAVDPTAGAPLYGADVAAVLGASRVVMGAGTAELRGARTGDEITFVGWDGRVHRRTVGLVVPDLRLDGVELAFSTADAATFGFSRPSSVWLWDLGDVDRLVADLDAVDATGPWVEVQRSWQPPVSDQVLSSTELKQSLGEVAYRPGADGTVTLDPAWVRDNIRTETLPIVGRVTCNVHALPDLRAALAEVQAAGLAGAIDLGDTRRYGGCWVPRLIRGPSGGSLSRHAYGIAYDMNPSSNPFGGTPTLDRRVVDIFRDHGFAWGGTWARPDGMHVEWVGGRSTGSP